MIELPDDELDKLFRKSSEELEPKYEPDDWNDLRKRLDQQDGKAPAGWWRKWWPLGVLALLIPAGIFLFEGKNGGKEKGGRGVVLKRENGGTEEEGRGAEDGDGKAAGRESGVDEGSGVGRKSGVVEAPEEVAGVKKENVVGDKGNPTVANANKQLIDQGNKVVGNGKKHIDSELKANEKEAGKSSSKSELNAAAGNNGRKLLPRSRSKAGGVYLEPNRSKVEGGDGAISFTQAQAMPDAQPTSPGESAAQAEQQTRTLISASALIGKVPKWNVLQLPGVSAPVQEVASEPAPKQSSMSADDRPLLAIRFGYSPDLSTVGLKDFSKPGTAVSLLVEYSVLPRLYLQSGAVWSRKDYYAPAEAYQLPRHGYYPPPALSGIDGVCKVLEVPLNVRFDIGSGERSRWFATGGFSSYHMNSEKYKYYYIDPKDPYAQKYPGWNGKTGWYWFSHVNVSAGYEYRISRKLSLLAEPSIRMPLKRVGYGKVNLITTGLWLSVRYTPVFK
ncbi:hypothetical protein [Dyadobacter sp. 676]|uniref:PorT family protein n=1 Tax=Dyadobacter sp. 676 TaxID=3088362 RepID=A0AAU8FR92_9BACT